MGDLLLVVVVRSIEGIRTRSINTGLDICEFLPRSLFMGAMGLTQDDNNYVLVLGSARQSQKSDTNCQV